MRLGAAGCIELSLPFDAVTQAQLRAVRPRGLWLARRGCWEFPLEAALELRRRFASRFHLEPDLARWMTWLEQPLPPLPPHRQLVQAAALEQPLADGRRLFAHQRAAARWLLARRGAVLADAMGLGKTLTALAAARAMVRAADCRVVVVAPAGLHHHWQQEAAALELHVELLSWARLPAELPEAGTVLIADEAHYAQNLASARTRAFLRLTRHPRLRAAWLLSGTPMKNGRPAQLFPLLAAIGHPLAADQRQFEERYCQGHWQEMRGVRHWRALGATQLEELHRLTRPLLLHRRKADCLDLPPKQRRLLPVVLSAEEGRGFQHRLEQTVDDYRRRAAAGLVRRDAEALAVFTSLRQIAASYKLPAAAALIAPLLARGEPVVVFSAFVASATLLQARLGGVLLTGQLRPPARQAVVDAFQAGRTSLLISTYGTGGLGFNLQRARHVVLLERPWTPGDAEQAEDRCHRIGQRHGLICHWLQLGVADQLVDDLIASKAERIAQLLPKLVRRLLADW